MARSARWLEEPCRERCSFHSGLSFNICLEGLFLLVAGQISTLRPDRGDKSTKADFAKRLENLLLRLRVYMAALQDYPCRLQMTQFG